MSSNTATGALATNVADEDAAALRRRAAEKCQVVLSVLHDSYNGYKQCVADTKDSAMSLLFDTIATNRSVLISQLSNAIKVDLGVEPYVILFFFFNIFSIYRIDILASTKVQLLELLIEYGLMLNLGLLMVEIKQPLRLKFIVAKKLLLHFTKQLYTIAKFHPKFEIFFLNKLK